MEKGVFNERAGQSHQMANGNQRKMHFSRSGRKEFHFPELPFIIQSKKMKGMEGTHLSHSLKNLQMLSLTRLFFVM